MDIRTFASRLEKAEPDELRYLCKVFRMILDYCAGEGHDAAWLQAALAKAGLLALVRPPVGGSGAMLRLVLHNDVSRKDCECAVGIFRDVATAC